MALATKRLGKLLWFDLFLSFSFWLLILTPLELFSVWTSGTPRLSLPLQLDRSRIKMSDIEALSIRGSEFSEEESFVEPERQVFFDESRDRLPRGEDQSKRSTFTVVTS